MPNSYVNKVEVYRGGQTETLIDLTGDTVVASALAQGYTAHDASGAQITGTSTGGTMVIRDEADSHGGTIRHITSGSVVQGTINITSNGTVDVAAYADAAVNVTPSMQSKTVSPTTSQQTVSPDSGYAGLSSVTVNAMPTGTAGTPSATKGTVSNHSVSVVPSVTNQTGYITGGTKTGTAVSVSASELVSGTKSISANGTGIDVTNYASVDVSVSGGSITVDSLNVTQNGTYTASSGHAYSPVVVNVGGGGDNGDITAPVRFFDYDGTLVASYSSVPSTLPSVPTHTGLTNGSWNYTLTQLTAQFNAVGSCDVGANYETTSGKTEIECVFADGRLSPYLRLTVTGTVVIDWGDGSAVDTLTGNNTVTTSNHTYAAAGSYTITLTPASGATYKFYGTTTYTTLHANKTAVAQNRVYSNCIKAVRLGASCVVDDYAFAYCSSLVSISLPSSLTKIGNNAFSYCVSLGGASVPASVTNFGNYAFAYCYGIRGLCLSAGALDSMTNTSGQYAFSTMYALQSISVPAGVTSIPQYAFTACYSLNSLTFGSSLTSIGTSAFNNCYGVTEYHFKAATPPTLANANAFTGIQPECKIYVPSASLSDYQTADKWSSYSSYMVGE